MKYAGNVTHVSRKRSIASSPRYQAERKIAANIVAGKSSRLTATQTGRTRQRTRLPRNSRRPLRPVVTQVTTSAAAKGPNWPSVAKFSFGIGNVSRPDESATTDHQQSHVQP